MWRTLKGWAGMWSDGETWEWMGFKFPGPRISSSDNEPFRAWKEYKQQQIKIIRQKCGWHTGGTLCSVGGGQTSLPLPSLAILGAEVCCIISVFSWHRPLAQIIERNAMETLTQPLNVVGGLSVETKYSCSHCGRRPRKLRWTFSLGVKTVFTLNRIRSHQVWN